MTLPLPIPRCTNRLDGTHQAGGGGYPNDQSHRHHYLEFFSIGIINS
jgi:hypothetical protein